MPRRPRRECRIRDWWYQRAWQRCRFALRSARSERLRSGCPRNRRRARLPYPERAQRANQNSWWALFVGGLRAACQNHLKVANGDRTSGIYCRAGPHAIDYVQRFERNRLRQRGRKTELNATPSVPIDLRDCVKKTFVDRIVDCQTQYLAVTVAVDVCLHTQCALR